MIDALSKLKRLILEPKIYALLVSSERGQILHLGVHFSLEEAYSIARKKIEDLAPHKKGESIDIDLWNALPARMVVSQVMEPEHVEEFLKKFGNAPLWKDQEEPRAAIEVPGLPESIEKIINEIITTNKEEVPKNKIKKTDSLSAHIRDFKESKNHLMQKLIADEDLAMVETLKDLLGPSSKKYVTKAIEKRMSEKSGKVL